MPLAGNTIRATDGYRRVSSTAATSTSSSFTTTETITDTITVSVVSGRTYAVRIDVAWQSSAAADVVNWNVREDNVTGTIMQGGYIATPGVSKPLRVSGYDEWTAGATGSKTFVVTGKRDSGSGNVSRYASALASSWIIVDQVDS